MHTRNHQKCYGIGKIWTLTSPKNNLGNAIEKGFFLLLSITISF